MIPPVPRGAFIVILTGAGISAESGLGTFRDKDGIWAQHDLSALATPEGFLRDPARVHAFYNARRAQAQAATPNAAHLALARLQRDWPGDVLIVTQNVDDLHERAGSGALIHVHGRLDGALCHDCGHRWPAPAAMSPADPCPACDQPMTRPDVVWFGEIPRQMDEIWYALRQCDLFVAIGTSGQVYPVAAFAQDAARAGATCLEINPETTAISGDFHAHLRGPATHSVPAWVDALLSASAERGPVSAERGPM